MYRDASLKAVMHRFDTEPVVRGQGLRIACGKGVEHPQDGALESAGCSSGPGRPVDAEIGRIRSLVWSAAVPRQRVRDFVSTAESVRVGR